MTWTDRQEQAEDRKAVAQFLHGNLGRLLELITLAAKVKEARRFIRRRPQLALDRLRVIEQHPFMVAGPMSSNFAITYRHEKV